MSRVSNSSVSCSMVRMFVVYVVSKEWLDEWIVVLWLVYFDFYFNNPSPFPLHQQPSASQSVPHLQPSDGPHAVGREQRPGRRPALPRAT